MARKRNTNARGGSWTEKEKQEVWLKSNNSTANAGKDACGKAIHYNKHGDTDSSYGWEIDHIKPVAKGGTDALSNLQALYWHTNRTKGDEYPWNC